MSATSLPQNPRGSRRAVWVLFAAIVLSAFALRWNLEAVSSWTEFRAAVERLFGYLSSFAAPDLSAAMLQRCFDLALETLAVALLGVAVGLVFAYPVALGASRCVVLGEDPARGFRRWLLRGVLEGNRLLLDAMRGVPDFAWAIVLANITGVNAVTGVLAIAISVGGILGKVLSEQWDNVDPARYAALRSTGAGRLAVFFYGVQPLAARSMLSFVLMRTECAVRNASVIGVVGGGGIGAALWDEYTDGYWPGVATVLLTLLAVTATADLLANLLRHRLRVDPNHPRAPGALDRQTSARSRWQVLGAVFAVLAASVYCLREPLQHVASDLARIEWRFVRPYTLGLFTPDLHWDTLAAAA
ncbi:MAG: ABC transporter permease subunit, partial [Planctomycetota bacterium]